MPAVATGPLGPCGPICQRTIPFVYSGIFLVCLAQFIGFTIWLKLNRRRAMIWADKNAARRTILPIYDWVLYWEIFYILGRAGFIYYIQREFAAHVWGTTIVFCASKLSQYFVIAYLVQSRMGQAAVCRAISFALWLFLITIVLHTKNRLWEYLLDLMIFTSVLIYTSCQRTGRYAWFFWYALYLIGLTTLAATIFGGLLKVSPFIRFYCLVFSDFCRVALHPVFLMLLLLTDSQWWRSLSDSIIHMGVRSTASLRRFGSKSLRRSKSSHRHSGSSLEIFGEDLPMTSVQDTLQTHLELIDFCALDFYSLQYLDKGSKGEVRRCKWIPKGERKDRDVALKSFGKNDITLEEMLQIGKEAFLSTRLDHPNIVKFFGLCIQPPNVHLVYEYCSERSLRHVLRNPKMDLTWKQRVTFALQAARGIRALHRQQIIHRDIKSRNLLVHFNGHEYIVKLCDFGSARLFHPTGSSNSSGTPRATEDLSHHFDMKPRQREATGDVKSTRHKKKEKPALWKRPGGTKGSRVSWFQRNSSLICCGIPFTVESSDGERFPDDRYTTYMTAVVGTLAYMAPELMPVSFPFTSDSILPVSYGLSADIFSFGYVAWELLSRKLPYYALKDVRSLLSAVLEGGRPPIPMCPRMYRKLILNCWITEPSRRPTADELVEQLESLLLDATYRDAQFRPLRDNPGIDGVVFPDRRHEPLMRNEAYSYQNSSSMTPPLLPKSTRVDILPAPLAAANTCEGFPRSDSHKNVSFHRRKSTPKDILPSKVRDSNREA
mmetsp:Transcript_22818/g.34031  ORF Transcript_22818/g.34031 Transcript_22818/m.34031 type:complete len:774 (-) Transcript_22818:330-2651(-)